MAAYIDGELFGRARQYRKRPVVWWSHRWLDRIAAYADVCGGLQIWANENTMIGDMRGGVGFSCFNVFLSTSGIFFVPSNEIIDELLCPSIR